MTSEVQVGAVADSAQEQELQARYGLRFAEDDRRETGAETIDTPDMGSARR